MKWNVFDKPNADKLACMLRRENVVAKKTTNNLLKQKQQSGAPVGESHSAGVGVWLRSGGWPQIPTDDLVDSTFCRPSRSAGFVFILLIFCIFTENLILFGIGIEKNVYICRLKTQNDYEYCNIEQPA